MGIITSCCRPSASEVLTPDAVSYHILALIWFESRLRLLGCFPLLFFLEEDKKWATVKPVPSVNLN